LKGLTLLDSFAPTNWAALNGSDADLGSTNPVLIGNNRVYQVGKAGVGYLLDAGHLGGVGGQLAQAQTCDGQAMGGVSHLGTTVFVPCPDGLAAVSAAGDRIAVRWRLAAATPGPAIVTSGAVWTVATGAGTLVAADPSSGRQLFSQSIGDVPSRFTSPAAGGGRVVVAAKRTILAFGN
jgi:outer membrane protein assembly factor BamB